MACSEEKCMGKNKVEISHSDCQLGTQYCLIELISDEANTILKGLRMRSEGFISVMMHVFIGEHNIFTNECV